MADNEDDVADNWEDADTEELERRMEERQKQLEVEKQQFSSCLLEREKVKSLSPRIKPRAPPPRGWKLSKNKTSTQTVSVPVEPQTQLPLKIQDSERTEYVAPIKILKRQSDSIPNAEPASNVTTTVVGKQHKTLAEREAEYASARARILGSSYGSEEVPIGSSQRKVVASRPAEGSSPQNVKRQPRGPNGSQGFKSGKH